MRMQIEPTQIGYIIVGTIIVLLVYSIFQSYRMKGLKQIYALQKREEDKPLGRGSWFARNCNTNTRILAYSLIQYGSLPLIFWYTIILLEPSIFPLIFENTLVLALVAILLGIGTGLDIRYQFWSEE